MVNKAILTGIVILLGLVMIPLGFYNTYLLYKLVGATDLMWLSTG